MFGALNWLSLILVAIYKTHISAHLWSSCRFEPSCSEYAKGCLHEHNFLYACGLISKRLMRCYPFGSFQYDPVPKYRGKN